MLLGEVHGGQVNHGEHCADAPGLPAAPLADAGARLPRPGPGLTDGFPL
jgi:hypothetical protein